MVMLGVVSIVWDFYLKSGCHDIQKVLVKMQGIQEFHRKYVLAPADRAANNVVVVCRLHYNYTLKQELDGTRAYLETDTVVMSVVNAHLNDLPVKFSVCVTEGQNKSLPVHHP